jgi:L-asparaginase/Glu-tRNA(Gln) amidotransferase subunit D
LLGGTVEASVDEGKGVGSSVRASSAVAGEETDEAIATAAVQIATVSAAAITLERWRRLSEKVATRIWV